MTVQLRRQPALRLEPEQLEEPVPILVISDDWDVAELYRLKLEVDGYRPTVVQTAGQALSQIPVCLPDIIYFYAGGATDVELDGWRRLRESESSKRTPIILVVNDGHAMDHVRRDLRPLDYLVALDGTRFEPGAMEPFQA